MTRVSLRFAAIAIVGLLMVSCGAPAAGPTQSVTVVEEVDPVGDTQDAQAPDAQAEEIPTPTHEEPTVEINPFEEGLSGGNSADFPFPATDDAVGFENLGGLYSYTTNFEMDRLIELYSVAIPTLGYTLNSDTVIHYMAFLSFEGEGQALTINISTNEDGTNKVSILVGTLQ